MAIDVLFPKDKVQQHEERNQKQEYKYLGSLRIPRGLKLWVYNPEKNEIHEAKKTGKKTIDLQGRIKTSQRVQYDPKNFYVIALNKKSALKKIAKKYAKHIINNL